MENPHMYKFNYPFFMCLDIWIASNTWHLNWLLGFFILLTIHVFDNISKSVYE